MTLNEFVDRYNGEYVEAGGSSNALNQCVDLANQYIEEVLGLPKILWTNAIDFPSKAGSSYKWIANTPEGIPQEGDLVIFDIGTYGHVSIFIEGTTGSFRSFDQNYPSGTPAHIQGHYYTKVKGWLHPVIVSPPTMTDQKRALEALERFRSEQGHGNLEGAINALTGAHKDLQTLRKDVESLKQSLSSLEKRVDELNAKLVEKEKTISDYQKQLSNASKLVAEQTEVIDTLTKERADYKRWYEAALDKQADKLNSWELFKLLISKLSWKNSNHS